MCVNETRKCNKTPSKVSEQSFVDCYLVLEILQKDIIFPISILAAFDSKRVTERDFFNITCRGSYHKQLLKRSYYLYQSRRTRLCNRLGARNKNLNMFACDN